MLVWMLPSQKFRLSIFKIRKSSYVTSCQKSRRHFKIRSNHSNSTNGSFAMTNVTKSVKDEQVLLSLLFHANFVHNQLELNNELLIVLEIITISIFYLLNSVQFGYEPETHLGTANANSRANAFHMLNAEPGNFSVSHAAMFNMSHGHIRRRHCRQSLCPCQQHSRTHPEEVLLTEPWTSRALQ